MGSPVGKEQSQSLSKNMRKQIYGGEEREKVKNLSKFKSSQGKTKRRGLSRCVNHDAVGVE